MAGETPMRLTLDAGIIFFEIDALASVSVEKKEAQQACQDGSAAIQENHGVATKDDMINLEVVKIPVPIMLAITSIVAEINPMSHLSPG
jgi:hypothetical protein